MGGSTGIVWFRRDLRLADHPALLEATARHDRLVALFVHDPALANPSGANRVAYLHATLDALDADLDGLLVERHGDPASVVARFAAEVEAEAVHVTEDFGPYGRRRDGEVETRLVGDGRVLVRTGTPYAVAPGTLHTKGGTPFKVFTPFSRAWRSHGWPSPHRAPRSARFLEGIEGGGRPKTPQPTARTGLPPAGERAAHDAADAFLERRVDGYRDDRDRPDLDRTSRLSPHLKYGTIHPRQLLDRLGDGDGPSTFATELCWRDFYADVLFHWPQSARRNFAEAMDGLEWDTGKRADERFEAWTQGQTGYPIVDAGMRQLLDEGWMHNRVRMIVASFLVKDLHVDWRRGARWFLDHLVDGDLASNQHGWQWTAGTGTDAAPFFRVFNPISQGQRFDPDGDYVRRYVPELRDLDGKAVHEPWAAGDDLFTSALDYPERIVDHAAEREEALARYGRR
ncbi:MAG: deoxyribodipyrimidine photo-lyase [Acidimicrobiales bacterium]|nr:deoxyribodipyrimidine photo-lyase [Acidimicrobiales bacterium]HRW39721.1 deoxyribodipyrimidine photo-lyase [Aquihabitans sp.]